MPTSSLAVGGLASGIDTKAIVDALITADRAPARLAEKNRTLAQSRLDAIKAMNTKFLALRDAMDGVEQKSSFATKKATSSNETALTASTSSTAVAGSMTINVKKLASAHQVATAGQALASTDLGAGTVLLRLASTPGGDPDITITPTTNTLAGIAEAINLANKGVVASVVNDGGASPYRLVVTSTKTGAANAITKLEGTGGYAGVLPNLGSLTPVTAGADAEVRLGDKDTGLLLKSASNVMDQAIPGVTLTLKSVADGVNVSVAQDVSGVKATVQKMTDAFNDALTHYQTNSTYNTTTKTAGALFNEYDLRGQLDNIERELTKTYTDQPTGFQTLAQVGVSVGTDGKFTINATTFEAKLAENQDAVAALFLAAGTAASVPMESLTRSVDGAMALKQSNLEGAIQAYTDRITAIDARLEKRRAYYQAKFLAMEKMTQQFQSQGASLSNFVSGLSKSK